MKSDGEIMEILEAYDLTKSFRAAAVLAGCSHHTVAKHVAARAAGRPLAEPVTREKITDEFLPKIEELVEKTRGRIRADVAHQKLVGMGYLGSERSTRRAMAQVKDAWKLGRVRVHRPWVTEPGGWLQYDFGDGPSIGGVKTVLFVAWLAWSRFRIVIALRDRTAPSVFAALNRCFRIIGGAPTYILTDNEKTVTVSHVAGVPVRNLQTVDFARYYGVTVLTCHPADPASKGGVENAVKVAKADIVPKETNLREAYGSFAEVEPACEEFMAHINTREHRTTKRKPAAMLTEEVLRLHRVPDDAHTVSFGLARTVPPNTPMVTFRNAMYSVPSHLLGQRVFVSSHGTGPDEKVVIVHHSPTGPVEVARHSRARPGSPAINDEHFPGVCGEDPGRLHAAVGTVRMNVKMAEAVSLAKIAGVIDVDRNFNAPAPNQVWVTDFTYVPVYAGFVYVADSADFQRALEEWQECWLSHSIPRVNNSWRKAPGTILQCPSPSRRCNCRWYTRTLSRSPNHSRPLLAFHSLPEVESAVLSTLATAFNTAPQSRSAARGSKGGSISGFIKAR